MDKYVYIHTQETFMVQDRARTGKRRKVECMPQVASIYILSIDLENIKGGPIRSQCSLGNQ